MNIGEQNLLLIAIMGTFHLGLAVQHTNLPTSDSGIILFPDNKSGQPQCIALHLTK